MGLNGGVLGALPGIPLELGDRAQFFYLPGTDEYPGRGFYHYATSGVGHYLRLWNAYPNWGCQYAPLVSGEVTRWVDMKADDGVPDAGSVQTMPSSTFMPVAGFFAVSERTKRHKRGMIFRRALGTHFLSLFR
jgi:hypothetical protein